MQLINIALKYLELNSGQLPNVPANPRDLTDDGFDNCKRSIVAFPEMLDVRSLVVVNAANNYVVIGGNQRLRALRELGYTDAPCLVVDWPVAKINEFIIKDNLSYGEWNYDLLANEWDYEDLVEWGLDLPFDNVEPDSNDVIDETEQNYNLLIETDDKHEFERIKKNLEQLSIHYMVK